MDNFDIFAEEIDITPQTEIKREASFVMQKPSRARGKAALLKNIKQMFRGKSKQDERSYWEFDSRIDGVRLSNLPHAGYAQAGYRINPDYTTAFKYKRKDLEIPEELRQVEKLKDPEIAESLKNWYEPVYDSNWEWKWQGSGWLPASIPYSVLRDEYNWKPNGYPPVRLEGGKADKWKLALVWNEPTRLCATYVRCDGIYGLRIHTHKMLDKVYEKNKKASLLLRRVILAPLPKHVRSGVELGGTIRRERLKAEANANFVELLGGLWTRE